MHIKDALTIFGDTGQEVNLLNLVTYVTNIKFDLQWKKKLHSGEYQTTLSVKTVSHQN